MSPNERRPQHEAGGERNDLGGSWSSLRLGPPCGCENWHVCEHVTYGWLREPDELGPRCSGADRYACGKYTSQQLEAIGARGMCCAQFDQQEGAA